MSFDLGALIAERRPEKCRLFEQHLNPQALRVLRVLGFDIDYAGAEGTYLNRSPKLVVPAAHHIPFAFHHGFKARLGDFGRVVQRTKIASRIVDGRFIGSYEKVEAIPGTCLASS